jgi:CheY-like chemotaxis protein
MEPKRLRRAKVLVVDDKPANHLAMAAVLETDYDLVFVSSGAEAIARLEKAGDVDVTLMDVHMPEMDG